MAYTLLVERVERRANTEQIVVGALLAAGADVEMPNPDEARDRFEEWLVSEPEVVTPEGQDDRDLLRALGVR